MTARAKKAPMLGVLQALADKTRLRLLHLMRGGEICVCYFVEILGEPQPKISRHLSCLRSVGLVDARRDGKWVHYSLGEMPPDVESVLDSVLTATLDDAEVEHDRIALEEACCAARPPRAVRHAPRPQGRGVRQ